MKVLKITKNVLLILFIIVIISFPVNAKSSGREYNKNKCTMYSKGNIIIYSKDNTKSKKISTYITGDKIHIIAKSKDSEWFKVKYKSKTRYIKNSKNISKKKIKK